MVKDGQIDLGGANPFEKAERIPKRLKMLLFGPTGSGKTYTALGFPNPVVIDTEHGTDLYGDTFKFAVKHTSDPDELMALAKWLAEGKHDYRTVVVDGLSVYWSALQKKWSDTFLLRRKGAKGYKHEFYDMQPGDWGTVKAEWHEFIRTLLDIDATIILTARQKNQYADNQFMKKVGVQPDAEKNIEYEVDVVLRLYQDETTHKRMAHVVSDRNNSLGRAEGDDFEMNIGVFKGFNLDAESAYSEAPTHVLSPTLPAPVLKGTMERQDIYEAITSALRKRDMTFSRIKTYWTKKYPNVNYSAATAAQLIDVLDKVRSIKKEKKDGRK